MVSSLLSDKEVLSLIANIILKPIGDSLLVLVCFDFSDSFN